MKKNTTYNFQQTQKIGENLAKQILKQNLGNIATVLGLQGELGAGKTTFLQGFAKGLGIKEKVNSPTFVIMKKFKIPTSSLKLQASSFNFFYHIDCYRLNKPEEILDLGFREIILNPENIVAIEWPEKIKKIMLKNAIVIKFKRSKESFDSTQGENKRELTMDK
ncbi:MAG: hypothetical protein UR31_C0013G0003 [Parcubacteria group bacterium GW2011_GWA2_33_14]|uniref:tRNA threonylcarbamoyladenosine biosynthesis protein TsaE n=1 Tax=Candidatus Staskawiczbacteria bacterium RIFCSPHIGHO2_02_FULL_33_16 TaxID=1802204 RepID=A0A1G2HTJ6_9BACT|nr:MAG: hypothetical protein UR31_C0013G0003 [Parcubacteria group bacterium GW2011_GWA2_33_14]OGZ65775.1 MAG: tRNA (adenosine(37)-N6)-threonylcarbamoyltransferase complex ATPase subunit type 1 TsaE [Candidatus Staskawiczbacteria bacterium RIFCSPHIGHO2_02_FULL_33_16]OGZ70855.1 MAG: tRNA (adenosine(37)-N6)-threonylcarbamoyltransferase complex ATPase subunit type 1 TsaE [Candidatus Staskawiczbacteria bacterium RIFCSPLOWO2_01_FULL_33_13]